MPLVNVMVNQRAYTIACDEGEEPHLRELAKRVDTKVRELLESVGQVGDLKLLLMAALLITDDYVDVAARLDQRTRELEKFTSAQTEAKSNLGKSEAQMASLLEAATNRVGDIAARLVEA